MTAGRPALARGFYARVLHPVEAASLRLDDTDLSELAPAYDAAGLHRSRTILVARLGFEVAGAVIVNHASEGINFSFLENAVEHLRVATWSSRTRSGTRPSPSRRAGSRGRSDAGWPTTTRCSRRRAQTDEHPRCGVQARAPRPARLSRRAGLRVRPRLGSLPSRVPPRAGRCRAGDGACDPAWWRRAAGLVGVRESVEPHHFVVGAPAPDDAAAWHRKVATIRDNYVRHLFPDKVHKARAFDALLDFLLRPDTMTWSLLHLVQGTKP